MLELKNQVIWAVLSHKGRRVLERAQWALPQSEVIEFYVREVDERGLWVSLEREDGERLLLLRWEYVQTLEMRQQTKEIGLVN